MTPLGWIAAAVLGWLALVLIGVITFVVIARRSAHAEQLREGYRPPTREDRERIRRSAR